ncbi:MAG: T9SS type A sorting domain-containing protein [Crocinitomicaceae bacterium]|nr:T9SS type A sorting domain-containing protein [Crocinitomicaceae bacterium]
MKGIRIEEPCSEKWNEMTPTQRGAFCQKCTIDIFDFSEMTTHQIKQTMKAHAGEHVCGRFKPGQLESLNHEFELWTRNKKENFQSRFMFALLLVFGLTLFSCSEEDAKKLTLINTEQLNESLAENSRAYAEKIFYHQDSLIVSEMLPYPVQEVYLDPIEYYELSSTEEVYYEEYRKDCYVLGGPMTTVHFEEFILETPDTNTETTLPEPIVSEYNPFETKFYPNPTNSVSTFTAYIKQSGQFSISVYGINGQLIEEIFSGELTEGMHQFDIDLTNQNSGMYFLRMWNEHQNETVKIIRTE